MKNVFNLFIGIFLSCNVFAQVKVDSVAIGQPIPDFVALRNASAKGNSMISLSDYADKKGVIIVFMTNQCFHCINYRERIKNFNKQYAKKGYPLITINPYNNTYATEDTFDEMLKNAKKEKYDFPYLQTSDEKLPAMYGVRFTPTVLIAQRIGTQFILKYKGGIDNDMENKKPVKIKYVDNFMNELLHNK
jgi:peroxiredoxin